MTDLTTTLDRMVTILLALAAAPFIATVATAVILILGMTFIMRK